MKSETLVWYRGIEADVAAAKNKKNVILHADENVCRILTFTNNVLQIVGFPAVDRVKVVAASDSPVSFTFNGFEYLDNPSFIYRTITPDKEEELIAVYRCYCENEQDEEFDRFLHSHTETRRDGESIEIDPDSCGGKFHLVITHEKKALGKIEASFKLKPTGRSNPSSRITEFNKKQFIDDLHRLMVAYGNPPVREVTRVFADNILANYAKTLLKRGIEFFPQLFDA